jgi:hypothetical protein
MLPRPRIRMPLSVAVAVVVAIYVVRSATRGFDFRPDLPIDAVVGVAFLFVLGVVAYLRHEGPVHEAPEDSPGE